MTPITIVCVMLVLLMGLKEWIGYLERRRFEKEYFRMMDKLLDRMMARNFAEYVQGEVAQQMTYAPPAPGYGNYEEENLAGV